MMKLSRIFVLGLSACLLAFACNVKTEEQQKSPVPSTKNQDIEKSKPSPREIDSIKSLKKKKSKRFDSLKPGVATLDPPL